MRPYSLLDVFVYIARVHDEQGNTLDFEVSLGDGDSFIYRVYLAKPRYYKLDHYKKGRRGNR